MLGRRRLSVAAAALSVLLTTACTGTTVITAAEPDPPPAAVDTADPGTDAPSDTTDGAATDTTGDNGLTSATPDTDTDATTDDATVSDAANVDGRTLPGWELIDVGAFSMAVPTEWIALTDPRDVESVIDDAQENGAPFQRQASNEFREMLENGNAIIALDLEGDNVNAFRQFGPAAGLAEHERMVTALEREFDGFADNVAFESEPRLIGETPGVLIRGRYDIDEATAYMYQFITHEDAHLYFFTVTFFSGDNPELATELFRSIEIG